MKFIRVLLCGFVIPLLENTIDCAPMKIYYVQMIGDIRAATEYESQTHQFTNKELNNPLFNTDQLLVQERWDMCNEASQIINEDGGYTLISKRLQPDILRSYAVDTEKTKGVFQTLRAFACPTKPPIYLHATDQSNTSVVGIIIRRADVRLRDPCADGIMLYVQKLVKEVRPLEELPWISGSVNLIREGVGAFDTIRPLESQLSLEMCKRARMNVFADRNISLLENTPADVKRLYVVQSEKNASLYSVVEAFGCPTIPTIYLQVRSFVEKGALVYWLWAIAETAPKLVQSETGLKYRYHLEIVQCVTISTQFPPDEIRNIPDHQRLNMCLEAVQVLRAEKNRNVEFLEGVKPGNSEFYSVLFKTNTAPKKVLAFKCPTRPALFLAAVEQHAWIFMEETEFIFPRLGIVGYQIEIISDIVEVTLSQFREHSSSVTVHTSVIGPECNVPDECRKLCEQTVSYLQERTQVDVEFFTKMEIGPSRYYVVRTEPQGRASVSEPRPITVQAFKCPTDPEIYLNIRLMVGKGNVMWIYVRKTRTAPTLNVARFEQLLFKEITEVSGNSGSRKSPKMSAVNTDMLEEEQRHRLCRSAKMYALSKPNLEYVENTNTGKLKFYQLDREAEDGRILRSVVQAFGCPTRPVIYLHISDQEDAGHVVWIIEKIFVPPPPEEIFPPIEFLTFDVKLVKSISKATTQETNERDIGSLLHNLTLDADTFPEQYRYRLCARAAEIVSAEKVDMRQNEETGPSLLYSITELRKSNYKPLPVKAFQCPSEPPLYLQVNKEPSVETYSVIILVMKNNLIDVRNEVQYFLKFVENIITVAPSTLKEYGSIESTVVDIELFTKKQRFQMCEEALKRVSATGRSVEILDGDTAPQKLYSLGLRSRDENLTSHTVQAFQCSVAPEVYLELHYWQSKGLAAWVIVKKREVARPSSETRERPRAPVRSGDSAVQRQPKPTEPSQKPFRESSRESRRPREGIRESQSSVGRPMDDAGIGVPREMKNFKVKFVEDIDAATSREIGSMSPSPRELSMVNTDELYSEPQRVEICNLAVRRMRTETIVHPLNGMTGHSRFFRVNEGFVVENTPEIKYVRAFECPTEPPLFLEVRHRKHKGTTVTIIMKEFKPIKYSISFMLKPVDSIEPAHLASNVNASGPSRLSRKGGRPIITNEFPPIKLLRMCKRAWRIAFKGRVQLSSADVVNASGEYVIDSDSAYSESVHAFKCATVPPIYLEVHRHVPGDYTILIIKEKKKRDTSELSSFSMEENITYQRKIVTTITQVAPHQIKEIWERMPYVEDSNAAIQFDKVERGMICRDAMRKCPDIEFEFDNSARRDITRTFILNAGTEREEYIRAFKCPTVPVLHIQLEEDEDGYGYTAWMIVAENRPPAAQVEERSARGTGRGQETSPHYKLMQTFVTGEDPQYLRVPQKIGKENEPSSSGARNVSEGPRSYPRHELQIVEKIVKRKTDVSTHKRDDLSHPEPINYSVSLRDRMCAEGRLLMPGKEFIGRLEDREPEDYELYTISYKTELDMLCDQVISAFLCPYVPPFIIQTYDETLLRRVTRVVIERNVLPVLAPNS